MKDLSLPGHDQPAANDTKSNGLQQEVGPIQDLRDFPYCHFGDRRYSARPVEGLFATKVR